MEYKVSENTRVFEAAYGGEFPVEIFYQTQFNKYPSSSESEIRYKPTVSEHFDNELYEIIGISDYKARTRLTANSKQHIYLNLREKFIVVLRYGRENKEEYVTIKIVYNGYGKTIDNYFNMEKIEKYIIPVKKSNISLVSSDKGYLDTREYDVKIPEVDLKLNYGSDFMPVHNKILTKLNTQDEKGIVMLHGTPGSGKSTYLKLLTKLIEEKSVLFIPPSMAGALSEPTIIPFLMDRPNSVLFIEDGEQVVAKREGVVSSTGVSNILNMTDGILGDCLKIQIVVTFNMGKQLIDDALLRKGRLIAEHQFDKLSVVETNKLLKHLGMSFVSDKPLTLADIYNIEEEEMKVKQNTKKIGFRS